MKNRYTLFFIGMLLSLTSRAQNISLDWVQTEPYQQENANAVLDFDKINNDVLTGIINVWVDNSNGIHAPALGRRNQQGVMIYDTLFNNNSYLDYVLRGFLGKNGETYYALSYQNNNVQYEKQSTTGHLLWQQTLPRANSFFTYENNVKGNNWVLDDSLNNRMLWTFEQWDPAFQVKSVGILATDNASGAITIIDTMSYSGTMNYLTYAFDLQRDNSGHIYLTSMDDNGRMLISLLDNGQLHTEAVLDSAGVRDYPQSMRIVGNTLFSTREISINNNSYFICQLNIYSIDSNGHLTHIGTQNLSDTHSYLPGITTYGNHCYVYTSCYQNSNYPSLLPTIWEYDNSGNLTNTFTFPSYTGKAIFDLSVTGHAMYGSFYTPGVDQLEIMNPTTAAHLNTYNLLSEFSSSSNDGAHKVEARSTNANTDVIVIVGNKWISQQLFSRVAKYTCTFGETGIAGADPSAQLSIFPNPAGNTLQLNYNGTGKCSIDILDLQGRVIVSQANRSPQQLIDISALRSGMYLLRVRDDAGVAVKRFEKL